MDDLNTVSYNAVNIYFDTLTKLGYKCYWSVNQLLALLAIEETLNILQDYITEDNLRDIMNAVYCLSGTTCLIQFPKQFVEDTSVHETVTSYNWETRSTETGQIRIGQGGLFRIPDTFIYH